MFNLNVSQLVRFLKYVLSRIFFFQFDFDYRSKSAAKLNFIQSRWFDKRSKFSPLCACTPDKRIREPFLSKRARGRGCYRASSRRYSFVPRGPLRAFCHAINRRVLLMVITIPWICVHVCVYIYVEMVIDRFFAGLVKFGRWKVFFFSKNLQNWKKGINFKRLEIWWIFESERNLREMWESKGI